MADALPDLDAHISFVVVDGEAVGPMSMHDIVASVRSGERSSQSLVWWDGATDWQPFDRYEALTRLLSSHDPLATTIVEPSVTAEPTTESPPSLTGLFSANARRENGLGSSGSAPAEASVEAIVSARALLASAEAQQDAITEARHKTLAAALSGPAALTEREGVGDHVGDGEVALTTDDSSAAPTEQSLTGVPDALVESDEPVDSKHEEHFEEMVKKSHEHQRRLEWGTRVDEVLLSGCIASITKHGYVTADLTSSEVERCVLFESESDGRFVRIELKPIHHENVVGAAVARPLEIKMSWGQNVSDNDAAFAIVRSLVTDEEATPGTVTAGIDAASSRVYTTVDLIWAAEDFVSVDYEVDANAIDDAMAAALHILERRWYTLFIRRR